MGEHYGWPFTTAWATIFMVFLAHVGRANDVPADVVTSSSGASRAVQQPASVVSTPAPNERMSASDAPPFVTAVKADTWIVPDIEALPNNEWGKTVRFGRKLTVATYADLALELPTPPNGSQAAICRARAAIWKPAPRNSAYLSSGSSPIFRSIARAKAKSAR
jgi:hypothetical protein